MRKTRKLAALVMAGLMAVSMTACGGSKEETTAEETTAAESKAEETAESESAGTAEDCRYVL